MDYSFINQIAAAVQANRESVQDAEANLDVDIADIVLLHEAEEAIIAHMEVIQAGYDDPTSYEIVCDLTPVFADCVRPLPMGSNQVAEIDLGPIVADLLLTDKFCDISTEAGDVEIAAHFMNGQQAGRAKIDWQYGMVACEDSGNHVIVENATGSRNTVCCTYREHTKHQFCVLNEEGEQHARQEQIRKSNGRDDLHIKPVFVALAYKGRSIKLVGTEAEVASFYAGMEAGERKEHDWLKANFFDAAPIE